MKIKMTDKIIRKYQTTQKHSSGAVFAQKTISGSKPFKVEWSKYMPFVEECSKYILSGNNDNFQIYENSGENKEITLRVDLLFEFSGKNHDINNNHILLLLPSIWEVISDCLVLDGGDVFSCVCIGVKDKFCVLEFIFPTIRINYLYYNETILPKIREKISSENIRRSFPDFKNDWDDVFQPMSNENHFYGCEYAKGLPTPLYKGIWESSGELYSDEIEETVDVFSIKSNKLLQTKCSSSLSKFEEEDGVNYLPLILTSYYTSETACPKEKESSSFSFNSDISSASEIDMLYNLFPIISDSVFDKSVDRYQIGRCVYNIFRKDREGIEFLKNSVKKNIDWEELWEKYSVSSDVENFLSIRTIGYYAKRSNKERYDQWHLDWMRDSIEKSYNLVGMDMGEVMYRYFWLDYLTVGSSSGRQIWYRMSENNNRLVRCIGDGENSFANKFSEIRDFYSSYESRNKDDIGSILGIKDSEKKTDIADRHKAVANILKKLGSRQGQQEMIYHCCKSFNRENVEKYFDNNPNLISWNNCVTEIHNDEIYKREGKMEDFITLSCEVDYHENKYNINHPEIKELMKWFKMVFIDEDVIDYFLKICASFLHGRNVEKSIYAFCGKGDNSKSMICKLLQKVLSVLAIDLPVSVLTDDRQDKEFGSAVASGKGARAAFVSEPEDSIDFQGNLLKRLTGGDRIYARRLYTDGESFIPMFKIIIGCNDVPRIENADRAVKDRLKILPFPSRFCYDAPKDVEEQFRLKKFPKDDQFEEKIDRFRAPMAWLMGYYFSKYRKEKLIPPQAVLDYNEGYWKRNDPYSRFVHENYEKTGDKSDKIGVQKIYKEFKSWYYQFMDAKKKGVPKISIFEKHLSTDELMGDPGSRRIWTGWRPLLESVDTSNSKRDLNEGID